MIFKHIFTILLALFYSVGITAQDIPGISPTAKFTDSAGEEGESPFSGSAPVIGIFKANPENVGSWNAHYEWRFYTEGNASNPYLIRYEQDTEFTFNKAGVNFIVCYATFTQGNDTVAYAREYWEEAGPMSVSISDSKLEMPNAFSPNGDGINDVYRAKTGYQSIVEFHAYIFNRWGQKIYEWSDPSGGWDGTFNGKDVKQGVYFCLVKAKGADGRNFNIKKDVNLLRGYTETTD